MHIITGRVRNKEDDIKMWCRKRKIILIGIGRQSSDVWYAHTHFAVGHILTISLFILSFDHAGASLDERTCTSYTSRAQFTATVLKPITSSSWAISYLFTFCSNTSHPSAQYTFSLSLSLYQSRLFFILSQHRSTEQSIEHEYFQRAFIIIVISFLLRNQRKLRMKRSETAQYAYQ